MARMTPSTVVTSLIPASVSYPKIKPSQKIRRSTRLRVSEAEYWQHYYHHEEHYEWNNGYLEVKPAADYVSYVMYDWLVTLLKEYLRSQPLAKCIALEVGFRLQLPHKVSIRKPDLGVVLNNNPIPLGPLDQSYHGTFDLCIESLSYSSAAEVKRDTVTKKAEYAQAGVKEYYVLDARGKQTAFYQLTANGSYIPIPPTADGVIVSTILPGWQFRLTDLQRQPSLVELSEDAVYRAFVLPALQAAKQAHQSEREARQKESEARQLAETTAQFEREARQLAEAKLQQLEAELARLRQAQ